MGTQDRAPTFDFYAKDWLADPKVRALSWDQRGRYIDLLASMWEHGTAGCQMPRATAEALYGKSFIRAVVDCPSPLLDTSEDESGIVWLYSDKLFQEAQKKASRRAAAQASAAVRWNSERNANA